MAERCDHHVCLRCGAVVADRVERMSLEERFWAKVEKGPGCWLWIGSRNPSGYGQFWAGDHHDFAHRVAYELAFGPIPEGLHVLHHCDNPPCVRPSHLFSGTHADNMADRQAKGRGVGYRPGHASLAETLTAHSASA